MTDAARQSDPNELRRSALRFLAGTRRRSGALIEQHRSAPARKG
jgi:hypothetical protein